MKWASAISDEPDVDRSLDEVFDAVRATMGSTEPDLLLAFVSARNHASYRRVSERINGEFEDALLLGCSASGVIGGGAEIERQPALVLVAAQLPGVRLTPFHVTSADLPSSGISRVFWQEQIGVDTTEPTHFVLLPDPFTFDVVPLLAAFDRYFPDTVRVGGFASGGRFRGSHALFVGNTVSTAGVVGIGLSGNVEVDTVVAQGCRPVGTPMFVTGGSGGTVFGLDGRRPAEILAEIYETAEPRDRPLVRQSLFLGLVMRSGQQAYAHGDFVVRDIIGLDARSGALHVAADLQEGQVVQFHVRDAVASAKDLAVLLDRYREKAESKRVAGALLFSCLGRGLYLYGQPGHDTRLFRDKLGDLPVGGFFCNGEIGPVQGTTFIHGYTSSFGLFRPKSAH